MRTGHDVELVRTRDRLDEVGTLPRELGDRVGLAGVLTDLNRSARPSRVPGRAPTWGFAWDSDDQHSHRWWPQGITTTADHADTEKVAGREVVLTSAYSKQLAGVHKGARLSVADVTDRDRVPYRHVLLVEAFLDRAGNVDLRPVRIHAGGMVWRGPYLYVAATSRGLYCFRLDDILAAPPGGAPHRIGRTDGGGVDTFGYRYLLPLRFTYLTRTHPGVEPMRYSFLSLDRSGRVPGLVAGEYGRGRTSTRLARYDLDPQTSLLRAGPGGASRPSVLADAGIDGMQGAVFAGGSYYLTTSAGSRRRGSLWVGRPGAFRRHRRALPVGPEDLAYWPGRDELWSLSEHPGRRYVFAFDRQRFS